MAQSSNQTPHRGDHDSKAKPAGTRAKLADARDSALDRARSAVEGIEANPVSVLVGGVAAGLIAGAFIPRSKREQDLLRPVGKRLVEGATAALAAAKETGRDQLTAGVMSRDAAKEGARKVFDSAFQAAKGTRDKGEPSA